MAKSVTERKREQRVRDKLSAKEKEALLLSRKIVTALYHSDDAALKRTMARTGIDEEQDLISRLKSQRPYIPTSAKRLNAVMTSTTIAIVSRNGLSASFCAAFLRPQPTFPAAIRIRLFM